MSDATQELSDAEARVEDARAALDDARSATRAAEALYRERQAEEDTKAEAYEQAIGQVRDLYAARRQGLEDQKRRAEEELKALEAKLEGLKAGNEPRIEPMKVDLTTKVSDGGSANGASAPEGIEDDWYQKLLLEASTNTPAEGTESED